MIGQQILSNANGIRLYFLSSYDEAYLIAFNNGEAKRLKKLGFELDNFYYLKPYNSITASDLLDFSIEAKGFNKLRNFKNPKALQEVKKYVVTSAMKEDDDDDSQEVWYAVIENQGMLVSEDNLKGFTKIPYKPLYKKVTSISNAESLIKKIQKIATIDNLDDLNDVLKVYFGSSVKTQSEPKEPKMEYTDKFLKEQFDLFNKKYFNDRLPSSIKLIWKSLKAKWGACKAIILQNKIAPVEIEISKNIDNYNLFRNTLVHEMCHADCYQAIPSEKVEKADRWYRHGSVKWMRYLGLTDETSHSGRFEKLTNLLNNKFKELHLRRLGAVDESALDDNGEIKKEVIDKVSKAHLMVRDGWNKKYLIFCTDRLFNEIRKNIREGNTKWPYGGIWTEYKFDPKKMAQFDSNPSDDIKYGYKYKSLGILRKMGAILGSRIIRS